MKTVLPLHHLVILVISWGDFGSAMSLESNSLRQRLLNGGKSYGPLLLSDSPVVAELLAGIGYDHVVIDMEHSPSNLQSCQKLLQAVDAASFRASKPVEAIVRLDSPNDPVAMKKILDSMRLPGGVLVPMVEDAATAERVARSTRYPRQQALGRPSNQNDAIDGIRECAFPFVRATGWGTTVSNYGYLKQCQEDLLVMVQVESPQGVEAIPEIASVPGIDLIFLGPFDLSCSAGKMGQFADSDVQALIARAEDAVIQSPCLLGGFRAPGVELSEMFRKGYSLVCGSVDVALLREAALADVQAGRDSISKNESS